MPRHYRLKQRALRQEGTRQRIVEATVMLHQELGPARTSISAVAERAGVQRHTVYRYFPNEQELFKACSGHFRSLHPLPDPDAWLAISDPAERLRSGLAAAYAYFRENEAMMASVLRDAEVLPVGGAFRQHQAAMATVLSKGWDRLGPSAQLGAAIGLAVRFQTWRALVRDEGLSDQQAVALMTEMVRCTAARLAAEASPRDRPSAAGGADDADVAG